MDKHIRKLDSDLARFEAEIQDKAISATRNVEEGLQKRKSCATIYVYLISIMYIFFSGGRKKIKDKEIKKKSASSEDETVTSKTLKKKQLKKGLWKTFYCSILCLKEKSTRWCLILVQQLIVNRFGHISLATVLETECIVT